MIYCNLYKNHSKKVKNFIRIASLLHEITAFKINPTMILNGSQKTRSAERILHNNSVRRRGNFLFARAQGCQGVHRCEVFFCVIGADKQTDYLTKRLKPCMDTHTTLSLPRARRVFLSIDVSIHNR